jgi:histidinol-phosphate aminotransferase
VVLRTCSKALGLAGIRLGFAVAGDVIAGALKSVKSPYNVNAVTHKIGEIILDEPEYIKNCVSSIKKSRDFLYNECKALSAQKAEIRTVFPPDTNFVLLKMADAQRVYEDLLSRSVIVRRLGDYLRVTAGSEKENLSFLKALREVLY